MAYMKPGCGHHGCHSCGHACAQVNPGGSSSCGNKGCTSCSGSCGHHGCHSCAPCNGYGVLRAVTGPFSNCGNWGGKNYPYYTGPCGPCEPCRNCCCPDWPWPPFLPVAQDYSGCGYSGCGDSGCGHHHAHGHDGHCGDGACGFCGGIRHRPGYACESSAACAAHSAGSGCASSCDHDYCARVFKPIVDTRDC